MQSPSQGNWARYQALRSSHRYPHLHQPHAASGLELLAAVAASDVGTYDKQVVLTTELATLHTIGSYNPAAVLPPKVVKRILEFVEMADLEADIWPEDPSPQDGSSQSRHQPAKLLVNDIRVWLECYARMVAVLATRFPEKAPELWAYQTTIVKVAHTYEGSNWVLYDRQYRRDMLARKDLNWSVPNTRLYNETFTGRARAIPRCPHCLSEDHTAVMCQFNPNPPMVGWYQNPRQLPSLSTLMLPQASGFGGSTVQREVCWNYNDDRCYLSRCRFIHACLECHGPHPATRCTLSSASRGRPTMG